MSGVVTAVAAVAAVGATIYSSSQQKKSAKEALAQQKAAQVSATSAAEEQAKASEEAINAANKKTADVSGAMERAAEPGAASTMLTGPLGVDPDDISLGKKTLLGGHNMGAVMDNMLAIAFADDMVMRSDKAKALAAKLPEDAIYPDKHETSSAGKSGAAPDNSQSGYRASSAAAGDRVKMATKAGSSIPKASVTAAQAGASKRTLLGE